MRLGLCVAAMVAVFFWHSFTYGKPKVQMPSGDEAWFCAPLPEQSVCEFHLVTPTTQPLRVAYPKAGSEVRFRLIGAKQGQTIRIELIPQEGWGNSMIVRTGGSTPFLSFNEAGVAIDRSITQYRQHWQELPAVVLFGRGTPQVVPTIQANLAGQYFITFTVIKAPPAKVPIEVRLGSEEFISP